MTIKDTFPNYRDCPKNYPNQIEWLYLAYMELKASHDVMKANIADTRPKGDVASGGATPSSEVGNGPRPIIMSQYPNWKASSKKGTLEKHFATLTGEPSEGACLEMLAFFGAKAINNGIFAQKAKCSKEQAIAWTYVLKIRGWIEWSEKVNPKGYILSKNRPLPRAKA